MATKLHIIRGLPGSGKSTYAKKHFPNAVHYEADMYFVEKESGAYQFDATKLREAHRWCQARVYYALCDSRDVVVTNTFTTAKEFDEYFDLIDGLRADGLDVEIHLVEMKTQFKNIHGVPEEKLEQMAKRWTEVGTKAGAVPAGKFATVTQVTA